MRCRDRPGPFHGLAARPPRSLTPNSLYLLYMHRLLVVRAVEVWLGAGGFVGGWAARRPVWPLQIPTHVCLANSAHVGLVTFWDSGEQVPRSMGRAHAPT
jgi:hypothetical protein